MNQRDYRDILGGGILVFVGAYSAYHATATLNLGRMTQMGPGLYPAALGVILAVLGLAILVPALFRPGDLPEVDLRSFIVIMIAVAAFAFLIDLFGAIPAIFALTAIASRADSKLSPLGMLILAAVLSVGTMLVFGLGLGMPIRAFHWPS